MRKWFDPLTTAWNGVITHKLRSFLTILGIVIGVGAVITLMSVGRGAEQQILSSIQSLGSNLITISPGFGFSAGGIRGGMTTTLTIEDAEAIGNSVEHISAVAPTYSSGMQLVAGNENTNASVTGTTPQYITVNNIEVANGTFFTQNDYDSGNKVVVLGSNVATTLFPDRTPSASRYAWARLLSVLSGCWSPRECLSVRRMTAS